MNVLQEHPPPFHGFNSKEAKSCVKGQPKDADDKGGKLQAVKPSTRKEKEIGIRDSSVVLEDCMESLRNRAGACSAKEPPSSNASSSETPGEKVLAEAKKNNGRRETRESLSKTPVLKSVSNILERNRRRNSTAKRLLQRAKSYAHHNTRNLSVPSSTTSDDKPNSGVRKFVLPVRSAHSSRVIKPNKRFIEELEENSTTTADKSAAADTEGAKHASKKAKVVSKDKEESSSKAEEKETRSSKLKKTTQAPAVKDTSKSAEPCERIVSSVPKRLQNIAGKRRTTTASGRAAQKSVEKSCLTEKAVLSDSIVNGQAFVPTKTLPESSESSVRSSRVQTRSETLGDLQQSSDKNASQQSCVDDTAVDKPKDATTATKGANKQNEATESLDNYDNLGEMSGMSESSSSENSDGTDDEQSEWSGTKLNGGKVILRKARLKLANNDIWDTEGPFSSSQNGE